MVSFHIYNAWGEVEWYLLKQLVLQCSDVHGGISYSNLSRVELPHVLVTSRFTSDGHSSSKRLLC